MASEKLISLRNISSNYQIDISFIHNLNELGLIEVLRVEEDECIDEECLPEVEKLMRMHYDLEINMAGIEAIYHLLQRVNGLQRELISLRNRLEP
jgi:hypothetical protein